MNWVEGVVCIAAIIGVCIVTDTICAVVRFRHGERVKPRGHGYTPLPPERNPGPPSGAE